MKEWFRYTDNVTGYEITQYTSANVRSRKPYFTTENFTPDDRYFFFERKGVGLFRAEVVTGELTLMAGTEYSGFAMDREGAWGVMVKDKVTVCKIDCYSGEITTLGTLPDGSSITGHLTTANTGRVACSCQLQNKIYALCILDPGKTESEVVYLSDCPLGHCQICPSDENQIFYVHETGGDALQRTWMCDVKNRTVRPWFVEQGEWITHEVWSWDGEEMAFINRPAIWTGDKEGHEFRFFADLPDREPHHPCISRDRKYICADTHNNGSGPSVELFERETGRHWQLAVTKPYATGDDHLHPSFNRRGDKILFSNPDADGNAQVSIIDISEIIK